MAFSSLGVGIVQRRGRRSSALSAAPWLVLVALTGLLCSRPGSSSHYPLPPAWALGPLGDPRATAGRPTPFAASPDASELRHSRVLRKEHRDASWHGQVRETLQAPTTLATEQPAAPRPSYAKRLRRAALAVGAVAGAIAVLRLATSQLGAIADGFSRVLYGDSCFMPVYIAAGAGAGALHTLSGPDHLAALAPLALRGRGGAGDAFRTGALWGSSHVLGQLLLGVGLLVIGRSSLVSGFLASAGAGVVAERLATLAMGSVLILIGGLGLKESREWDEDAEEEEHEAHGGPLDWRTLGTGILSGMHPDALLLCLPALALPSRIAGLAYLTSFGVGTLTAMGAYAAALRAACRALGGGAVRRVAMISSGVAIALGGAICCSAFGVSQLAGIL